MLFWTLWSLRITSWICPCYCLSQYFLSVFRVLWCKWSLDLSPPVWSLHLSPALDPKDLPVPDPPLPGRLTVLLHPCTLWLWLVCLGRGCNISYSATAAHPKTRKRKAVLAPGCQRLLGRGSKPVPGLTTTALQRLVPPHEVRAMAGVQSSVERKRGEGVWSELGVHGGSKAEGMPED